MSQDFIYNVLKKKKGKWFSKHDLKPIVPCNETNLVRNMSKLARNNKIYKIKVKREKKGILFLKY